MGIELFPHHPSMPQPLLLRHQPLKFIYNAYTIGSLCIRFPCWALVALIPRLRTRPSWTYRETLMIKFLNALFLNTFRTGSWKRFWNDPRTMDADHAGLVWIDPNPNLVVGEIKELAQLNKVEVARIAAYWYGERDPSTRKVGQRAAPDEIVVLALHCKCFSRLLYEAHTDARGVRQRGDLLYVQFYVAKGDNLNGLHSLETHRQRTRLRSCIRT